MPKIEIDVVLVDEDANTVTVYEPPHGIEVKVDKRHCTILLLDSRGGCLIQMEEALAVEKGLK